MWVYVVVRETRHGDEIVKISSSKVKAEAYQRGQNQQAPFYSHRVDTYWCE